MLVMSRGNPGVSSSWPIPLPFKTLDPSQGSRVLKGKGIGMSGVGG